MRLLIAEDELISRRLLVSALARMGHDVLVAEDGQEAWEILQREDIRLVVADWEMPRMDGLELVRRIRAMTDRAYIYTILLTSRGEKQDVVHGMESGADDYVTKPWDDGELMVRLKAGARVLGLYSALDDRNRQLERMALVDGLTGIANRRAFDLEFQRLREQARRFWRALSVIMVDIDRFKLFNDTLGHEAGDNALRHVAQLLQRDLRQVDTAYRYGGEEFVCLLPETEATGALIVAERLREGVVRARIAHPGNPPLGIITVSLGVATFDMRDQGEDLVRHADTALYAAKAAGRNCVVPYGPHCVVPAGR
jgi:diguanylate cyclase (GGDEF)-like protein